MGLKFRRGTTAQKSGSLAFGEPYVNTTLGTLQIGGDTGDITLGASGTGSQGSFAGISGSSLDITGNAKIDGNLTLGGNITIGDNTSDSVNVVASLSSSLIPQTTNIFDLGSATKFWRDLYISTGSIKMVNPANNQVVTTITAVAGGGIQIGNVQISTASISFVDNNGNVTQNVAQSSSAGSTSNFTTTSSFNSYTSSNDTTNTAQSTRLTTIESVTGSYETKGRSIVSGSSQITYASISSIPAGIVSGSSQVTPLLPTGVVSGSAQTIANLPTGTISGSSQISHDSTTGFVANKHVDHTSVLISAGNGLSGGGDISSTRTLTLDSGSTHFTNGIKTTLNSNTVISGSSQVTGISNAQLTNSTISGISLGSNLATLTISTGLSGTSYNGSGAITIANTGVTSNVAGTGITVSGATGAVTITNAGVTSAVAGTGVTVSGATGAVTVSIGQAVGTTSTPTFGNLTINGTITATGDITAFFTSDIRHKNNVQLIDNALDKVNALNGVTWEWNDDVDEVTKTTPKTGLIAQDVLDVLPEVVKTRENGFLALDYSKMVGLLVEAIKEQDIVIQKLKSDMVGLSTTITVFEDRMKEKGLL